MTEKKNHLFKQIGFRQTLGILKDKPKMTLNEFYNILIKYSYYNSFLRVKERMISCGLIKVKKIKGKKNIEITEKGIKTIPCIEMLEDLEKLKIDKND